MAEVLAVLQTVDSPYPGEAASAAQLLKLANEYRVAADNLQKQDRKKDPLSWAPCRLAAIQAIELYLNAFLIHKGMTPAEVRAMQHCLVQRTKIAQEKGFKFRIKTAAHLHAMTGNREYLVT